MGSVLIDITVLLALACFATAALRRSSAALRHVIWTCAIVGTLLIAPLRWRVPQRAVNPRVPVVFTVPLTSAVAAVEAGAHNAPSVREMALFIWPLGSALIALSLIASAWRFHRVVHQARSIHHAGNIGIASPIPVFTSPHIPGPLVTGFLRPVILLPDDSFTWPAGRRRAVLAHEFAHIRRRDPPIFLAAHLAIIVYWFHPLCWLAAARLRAESERACDDAALRIGLLPSSYAGHLLEMARMFNPQPAIPMATTSHLESRVKAILDPVVNRSSAARRSWLIAALLTAAVIAPLTAFSLRAQATGVVTITGTVIDPSGAVVPRAQVIALNSNGNAKEIATSDATGTFTFNNIPAGRYSIEVQVPGFSVTRIQTPDLANGAALRADAKLVVGSLGERIQVVAPGTPRPSSIAAISGPLRVGGNLQAAKLLQQVRPVYPAALQAQGIEGTVLLSAVISKDGVPVSLTPQNSAVEPEFVTAALDAVKQWRYQPTLLNGQPIEVITTITMDFKLRQNAAAQ